MQLILNTSAEYNATMEQREVVLVLEQGFMSFEDFKYAIENIHAWERHCLPTQSLTGRDLNAIRIKCIYNTQAD